MIYIERTPLSPEVELQMRSAQQKIIAQHDAMRTSKGLQQRGLEFSQLNRVKPSLEALFRNKCAYCETLLTAAPGDVENFRPKSLVADPDGNREGYWWLAYVWENLLLACGRCNRLHKLNKFPIDGPPAPPLTTGPALQSERPLLIDPTFEDPSEYLSFDERGRARPAPSLEALKTRSERDWKLRRATTTIELLGLNRDALVNDRGRLYRTTQLVVRALAAMEPSRRPTTLAELTQLLDPTAPYRAATSQWITESALANAFSTGNAGPVDEFLIRHGAVPEVVRRVMSRAKRPTRRATREHRRVRITTPKPSAPTEPTRPPVTTPAFVRRVSIRNFKGIKQLDLDLPIIDSAAAQEPSSSEPDADQVTAEASSLTRTGWYVLLGENSAGKSSVLEAVALALMGKDKLSALVKAGRIALEKLVHQPRDADPKSKRPGASIHMWLEPTQLGEIDLRINAKSFRFAKGGAPVPTLVRGYGYVRLLPRLGEPQPREGSSIRCDNLFDPREPLCDAERWMATLPYDQTKNSPFDVAAGTILKLLPDSTLANAVPETEEQVARAHLEPRGGRVVMVLKGRELNLDQLSAGYQSVIALAADIMAGISAQWLFDMREACGVVLLDEVGTQLHPSWRMRAIGDLRAAFPRMQFIATTHEPLCLKEVSRDEVVVLKRDAATDEVTTVKSFQSPRTLRVDQLLTSPLFGLDSTIEPRIDRLFQRYFALLARRTHLTTEETAEYLRLERELAPHRGLGYTRSDQLVYALLEQYLAGEGRKTVEDVSQVPTHVREKVFNVWRSVRSYRQARP
jgi:uncharacterized protein (TIGR02646 family)